MARIAEIAPDVYAISTYFEVANFQFNVFLLRDDAPLLFHTGLRRDFPEVHEAVAKLINPSTLRWISFSHFEADECGALNQWLAIAPQAEVVCSLVGAYVSVYDYADRSPRILRPEERLETGRHRLRLINTAQVPHGWDAAMLFDEGPRTLFCSDLFSQIGQLEPLGSSEGVLLERTDRYFEVQSRGPMAHSIPYNGRTKRVIDGLVALQPATLAVMHGTCLQGDGAKALAGFSDLLQRHFAQDLG